MTGRNVGWYTNPKVDVAEAGEGELTPQETKPTEQAAVSRSYCVVFESTADGILASIPALPGCFSIAATRTDAETEVRDAASLYLGACLRDGDAIPDSETFRPMIPSAGCRVAVVLFTTEGLGEAVWSAETAGASPIMGYEITAITRRHILARRLFDHRKIVLPFDDERRSSRAIQHMMNRVITGDRSFRVSVYREG